MFCLRYMSACCFFLVHSSHGLVEWVKKAGAVVVAPSSNPKFFFFLFSFYAGKTFGAYLFLSFRKVAQEKFYMRMVFKASEKLRRNSFLCAWFGNSAWGRPRLAGRWLCCEFPGSRHGGAAGRGG